MTKKQRADYMRELGKKGGAATKKKHGTAHFKRIGKRGQEALLAKLTKDL